MSGAGPMSSPSALSPLSARPAPPVPVGPRGRAENHAGRACGPGRRTTTDGGASGTSVPAAAIRADRGSGTLWVVAFALVIWTLGLVVAAGGHARAVRHRAGAAADLAALAGARRAADGPHAACAAAAVVARANGGLLRSCITSGRVVDVVVALPAALFPMGEATAVGRARAGPASAAGLPPPDRTGDPGDDQQLLGPGMPAEW